MKLKRTKAANNVDDGVSSGDDSDRGGMFATNKIDQSILQKQNHQ